MNRDGLSTILTQIAEKISAGLVVLRKGQEEI